MDYPVDRPFRILWKIDTRTRKVFGPKRRPLSHGFWKGLGVALSHSVGFRGRLEIGKVADVLV